MKAFVRSCIYNLFLNYLGGNGNDARCRFDMQDMAECSFDWGCKCQDSRNNTYTCLRSLTQTEDSLFCQVKIDKSTASMAEPTSELVP